MGDFENLCRLQQSTEADSLRDGALLNLVMAAHFQKEGNLFMKKDEEALIHKKIFL